MNIQFHRLHLFCVIFFFAIDKRKKRDKKDVVMKSLKMSKVKYCIYKLSELVGFFV